MPHDQPRVHKDAHEATPAGQDKHSALTQHMARAVMAGSGSRFTTVKRGELGKGMLTAMLRQLNIDRREF